MKLTDIQQKTDARFINRVMNAHFESKVNISTLKENTARTMLTKVRALIKETKGTPKFHTSEKSPAYLQLLMMEQSLTAQLQEYGADSARYQGGTAYSANTTPSVMTDIKDEDEDEDEDEMEEACGASHKKKKMKESKLTESEVETAQVVLAAQDMLDKVQGMLEDVADMQFKDLPSLVEMMRNEVGVNEAQAYLDSQTATLSGLVTTLEQAKADMTTTMAPLTGDQALTPDEFATEPDLDAGVDNDTPPDANIEADSDGDITEPDLEPDLGRERR